MIRKALLALLLVWTWGIVVFHLGEFGVPPHPQQINPNHQQIWIPKEKFGVNQLVLTGNPFERGLAAGRYTRDLLFIEENSLVSKLKSVFPSPFILRPLQILMIRWFWGADRYFEPWALEEMDGVSRSASTQFDDLGSRYNRQLYYHGLHEVGQMMVDQSGDDMGCTVVAFPFKTGWIIGRNFDFEGGREFDEEKIIKWVFPDRGNAFVSVIWAGMVGAVTGVNEHGLYISLNAAGSRDFRRYGTPTTLVILKALQFAKNADEAVEIIRNAETFITDIFVVSDRASGKLYRIEKSPHHTEVIPIHDAHIVTNHLISPYWKNDSINLFRRDDLTSGARAERGEKLIAALKASPSSLLNNSRAVEERVLSILRDKGEKDGKALQLGNRNAIDALIATHSVVYDEFENKLFVSQGPSLAGAFTGFDLTESFRKHEPVVLKNGLDRDPLVSGLTYLKIKQAVQELKDAERLIKTKRCSEAKPHLDTALSQDPESYTYSALLGDYQECTGDHASAVSSWKQALQRHPAYSAERRSLKKKLGES